MDFSSRILAAAASVEQFPLGVRASVNPPVPTSTKNIAVLGNIVVVTNGFQSSGGLISGSLSCSLDGGATWNTKNVINPTTGATVYLNAIVADPILGQFIAAGLNVNVLFRSTNGVNWSLIPGTTFSSTINGLFYFTSGLFSYVLLGGGNPSLFTSLDGITWTSRNIVSNRPLDSIAYGNSAYIIVGKDDSFNRGVFRTTDFSSSTTPTFTQVTPSVDTLGTSSVVFVNNTFIISALISKASRFSPNATEPCTSFIYKSTNDGLNFSLATPGEAYLSNVEYGMFVNGTDEYTQTRPSATTNYSDEITYAHPNRGNPLSFSSPTYSLDTRLTTRLTTTTTTPTVFGINSIDSSPDLPNGIFGSGGYRINRLELFQVSGTFRIVTYNNASPNGTTVTGVTNTLMDVTLRGTLTASNPAVGYAFVIDTSTYLFFFANAVISGTHYFGTTAYSTTNGSSFTQFTALPSEFNVSGATSASGADYDLTILRGEFGAGGYSYAFNYGPISAVDIRYMTSTTGTSAWTVRTTRVANSQYVSYSTNDRTGSSGSIGYLSNGYNALIPPPNEYKQLVFQRSNNFTLAFTAIDVTGLDGSPVLFDQCTDMTFISSAFRLFCTFNNLLGQPVSGIISITTAGVVSHTVISNFSNMKVLGTANSTIFVVSMDTGAVYTSTNGTTYTLQTTWDSPAMSEDIFTEANGGVYISGRFLDDTLFRSTNTANWFTSANGSSWVRTPVTTPASSALALRASYPSKYVDTQSGQKVAIFTGIPGFSEAGNRTSVGVANSGSSLAVMPYKNLSINNPRISFNTVARISSGDIVPTFGGTARLNLGDTAWTINQNTFDPDTDVATVDPITTAVAQGSLITYVITSGGVARLHQATQIDPENISLLSLPTIGTDYSFAHLVSDDIKILASVFSTVGGAARRNYVSTDDGATWSAVTNTGSSQIVLVFADPGKTIAGTDKFLITHGSNVYVTADAGSTWNTVTIAGLDTVRDASFADGMWVVCGRIQTGTFLPGPQPFFAGRIFSSVNDGVSWTQQYTTTTTGITASGINLATIAPTGNAKQFVCSGIGTANASVVLLSNTSGTTYVETTGQRFTTIEYGAGGTPVLLAQRSDNFIYGSNDGNTWTQQSQFALSSTAVIVRITQTNTWFVVVPTSSTDGTYIYSF